MTNFEDIDNRGYQGSRGMATPMSAKQAVIAQSPSNGWLERWNGYFAEKRELNKARQNREVTRKRSY